MHKGQPKFAYNWFGRELHEVSAPKALPPGAVTLRWEFIYDGGKIPGGKIVIGVGPVGEAFDPPLEWNGVG